MANRWIGFIVTTAANVTIFTPMTDGNILRNCPLEYWEERWENHPAVGNYGVVDDATIAARIVDDLVRAGFDVIFTEERS